MSFPKELRADHREELESLEAEANSPIEFREFVPVDKLDPVYFESSYHLAPSKGAEKPYRLLAETLKKTSRVAIAQTVLHEKESLVIVRSVRNGLVLHFMYFANEVRDFDQILKAEARRFRSPKWIGRGACTARWSIDNVLATIKPADKPTTQQQGLTAPERSEPARVSDRKEKPIIRTKQP